MRYGLILRVSERRILQRGIQLYEEPVLPTKPKPLVRPATRIVKPPKSKKTPRVSRIRKRNEKLRVNKIKLENLVLERAKKALELQKKQKEALEKKVGYKLPLPFQFPLDLRGAEAPWRPLIFHTGTFPKAPNPNKPNPYSASAMLAWQKRRLDAKIKAGAVGRKQKKMLRKKNKLKKRRT